MYDPTMIQPMRDELANLGVIEAKTAILVDQTLENNETVLCIINSVCGCAAANARPAVAIAKSNEKQPKASLTVFAGNDLEATSRLRGHLVGYAPSSPNIGLFKNGKVVFHLERHQIEGRTAQEIASDITQAYNKFC